MNVDWKINHLQSELAETREATGKLHAETDRIRFHGDPEIAYKFQDEHAFTRMQRKFRETGSTGDPRTDADVREVIRECRAGGDVDAICERAVAFSKRLMKFFKTPDVLRACIEGKLGVPVAS